MDPPLKRREAKEEARKEAGCSSTRNPCSLIRSTALTLIDLSLTAKRKGQKPYAQKVGFGSPVLVEGRSCKLLRAHIAVSCCDESRVLVCVCVR